MTVMLMCVINSGPDSSADIGTPLAGCGEDLLSEAEVPHTRLGGGLC